MSWLRSQIAFTIIVSSTLLAQSADQTRAAKEDTLRYSLFALRMAIDNYTHDQHQAPKMLRDLVTKEYLKSIPMDPMTSSSTMWRVVMEDPSKSARPNEPGIFDVRSSSDGISSDGSRYADW